MQNIIKKIFGDKNTKDVKILSPVVDEINQEYEKLKGLSDEELKAKTPEFKERISEYTAETRGKIEEIRKKLQSRKENTLNVPIKT